MDRPAGRHQAQRALRRRVDQTSARAQGMAGASDPEAEARFRALSLRLHPDKTRGGELHAVATEAMKKLNCLKEAFRHTAPSPAHHRPSSESASPVESDDMEDMEEDMEEDPPCVPKHAFRAAPARAEDAVLRRRGEDHKISHRDFIHELVAANHIFKSKACGSEVPAVWVYVLGSWFHNITKAAAAVLLPHLGEAYARRCRIFESERVDCLKLGKEIFEKEALTSLGRFVELHDHNLTILRNRTRTKLFFQHDPEPVSFGEDLGEDPDDFPPLIFSDELLPPIRPEIRALDAQKDLKLAEAVDAMEDKLRVLWGDDYDVVLDNLACTLAADRRIISERRMLVFIGARFTGKTFSTYDVPANLISSRLFVKLPDSARAILSTQPYLKMQGNAEVTKAVTRHVALALTVVLDEISAGSPIDFPKIKAEQGGLLTLVPPGAISGIRVTGGRMFIITSNSSEPLDLFHAIPSDKECEQIIIIDTGSVAKEVGDFQVPVETHGDEPQSYISDYGIEMARWAYISLLKQRADELRDGGRPLATPRRTLLTDKLSRSAAGAGGVGGGDSVPQTLRELVIVLFEPKAFNKLGKKDIKGTIESFLRHPNASKDHVASWSFKELNTVLADAFPRAARKKGCWEGIVVRPPPPTPAPAPPPGGAPPSQWAPQPRPPRRATVLRDAEEADIIDEFMKDPDVIDAIKKRKSARA